MIELKTRSDHKKKSLLIKKFLVSNEIKHQIVRELGGSKTYICYQLTDEEYNKLFNYLKENYNYFRFNYAPEFDKWC